jgi:hypothetical protein
MQIKNKMWFLIGFSVLIAGLFVYRYPLMNLVFVSSSMDCSYSVLSEVTSPDGQYIATAFERNCGAVTPYTRVVSVRHRESRFDGGDDHAWVFVTKDQPTIQIRWSSQRQLSVTTDGYSRTPREQRLEKARWEDVEIVQAKP